MGRGPMCTRGGIRGGWTRSYLKRCEADSAAGAREQEKLESNKYWMRERSNKTARARNRADTARERVIYHIV